MLNERPEGKDKFGYVLIRLSSGIQIILRKSKKTLKKSTPSKQKRRRAPSSAPTPSS